MLVRAMRRFIGVFAASLANLGLLRPRPGATVSIESQAYPGMVGDTFHLINHTGSNRGNLKLTRVEEIDVSPDVDQFHLHLRSNHRAQIPEGIYRVTNWHGHPNFDLHVQPCHVDSRKRQLYIASFARIREEAA